MSFRKEFLWAEARKLVYLAILAVALRLAPGIQNALMRSHFENAAIDLVYVLAVAFLPSLIYSAMSVILFSLIISVAKMKLLPPHILEKKYFGLSKNGFTSVLIYSAILALALYGIPYLNIGGQFSGTLNALSMDYSTAFRSTWNALLYVPNLFFVAPLYVLSPLKISSVIAGALYAFFLVHVLSVRAIENKSEVYRSRDTQISEEGRLVGMATRIVSPLPILSYVGISPEFREDGIKAKGTAHSSADLLGTKIELENSYQLSKGFYSADIVGMLVITPPFFSKIYRASGGEASVTVIPKEADMHLLKAMPSSLQERGSMLTKKMMNSSSDFAGIKEYVPGDQLNRIWWQGLARHGKLLTKNFYSTGEDSIILLPDLSDPNAGKECADARMAALTNIVNICSKKDISVSIYPVCGNNLHAEATRSKKELMFFIMNLNTITLLSPQGAEKIFESALPRKDYCMIRERCKKSNITLSSLYGASRFNAKAPSVFSWERKSVFRSSTQHFFRHQRKRNKALLITNSTVPLDALVEFRAMCIARKFRYVVIVLGEGNKKELMRLEDMRARHIPAVPLSYADAQKVSKIYSMLGGKIL